MRGTERLKTTKNHLPSKFDFDLCLMLNWLSYAEHLTRVPLTHTFTQPIHSNTLTHSLSPCTLQRTDSLSLCVCAIFFRFIESLHFYQRTNVRRKKAPSKLKPNKAESKKISTVARTYYNKTVTQANEKNQFVPQIFSLMIFSSFFLFSLHFHC